MTLQHVCFTTTVHALSAAHLPGPAGPILPRRRLHAGRQGVPVPAGVGQHRHLLPHVLVHEAHPRQDPLHIQYTRPLTGLLPSQAFHQMALLYIFEYQGHFKCLL